ncbi:MAG: hypothetical protein ACK4MF_09725 [Hyphomicrobiaceae bacterium]
MSNGNDPDNGNRRFRYLLQIFNWSRQTLRWIMSATDRDIRLPLFHRSFASGTGLSVLAVVAVVPIWVQSPNAMYAFVDVVTKFPFMIALPAISLFALYSFVFGALQPLGAFSEHFMRGFMILPFMAIHALVPINIIILLVNIPRLW